MFPLHKTTLQVIALIFCCKNFPSEVLWLGWVWHLNSCSWLLSLYLSLLQVTVPPLSLPAAEAGVSGGQHHCG